MATISPLVYQQREEERAQMEASSDSNKGDPSPEESKLRALSMVDLSDNSFCRGCRNCGNESNGWFE